MEHKKFGALSSSVNPNELATTVTGFLKTVGGIVAYLGYTQVTGDINTIIDQIGVIVTAGYSLYGACEVIFGIVRKLLVFVQHKIQG